MGRLATADWSVTAESGLTCYLWEIRRFPMLEPHEEYVLAKRWREHGDVGLAVRHERKGIRAIRIDAELLSERTSLGELDRNEAKIAAAITFAHEAAAARA